MKNFSEDWFTHYAGEWLKRMKHLQTIPANILEIGSYEGQSTCWILENLLTHPMSRITCVDVWDGTDPCLGEKTKRAYEKFIRNTSFHQNKMAIIHESSIKALPRLIESKISYDVVFVDGNHEGSYVLQDLSNGWKLLKNNGWLVLDDYNWEWKGLLMQPKEAFGQFLRENPEGIQWDEPEGRQLYAKKVL